MFMNYQIMNLCAVFCMEGIGLGVLSVYIYEDISIRGITEAEILKKYKK